MRRLLVTCLSMLLLIGNFCIAQAKPLNIPVVYYKLPNGLKVVISEDHNAPVVTVAVYYNVGFRVEPKARTGFAHLFEHMMFQGSANVKKFEHAKFVEANGGSLNGHTDLTTQTTTRRCRAIASSWESGLSRIACARSISARRTSRTSRQS